MNMDEGSDTTSIIGLEEIKPLRQSVVFDITGSDGDLRAKINEILEKVNVLIRIKNEEVNR